MSQVVFFMVTKKQAIDNGLKNAFKVGLMFDATREGVSVPERFRGMTRLVLDIGLALPIPIPDLQVHDTVVTATLSFGSERFHCIVPMSALYAVTIGEQVFMWDLDAPSGLLRVEEKVSEEISRPPPVEKKPRHLKLVD